MNTTNDSNPPERPIKEDEYNFCVHHPVSQSSLENNSIINTNTISTLEQQESLLIKNHLSTSEPTNTHETFSKSLSQNIIPIRLARSEMNTCLPNRLKKNDVINELSFKELKPSCVSLNTNIYTDQSMIRSFKVNRCFPVQDSSTDKIQLDCSQNDSFKDRYILPSHFFNLSLQKTLRPFPNELYSLEKRDSSLSHITYHNKQQSSPRSRISQQQMTHTITETYYKQSFDISPILKNSDNRTIKKYDKSSYTSMSLLKDNNQQSSSQGKILTETIQSKDQQSVPLILETDDSCYHYKCCKLCKIEQKQICQLSSSSNHILYEQLTPSIEETTQQMITRVRVSKPFEPLWPQTKILTYHPIIQNSDDCHQLNDSHIEDNSQDTSLSSCDACLFCQDVCSQSSHCKTCSVKNQLQLLRNPSQQTSRIHRICEQNRASNHLPFDAEFTPCQVARHTTRESGCWVMAHGIVYDATSFLDIHPAGAECILRLGGKDVSRDFDFHSTQAQNGPWRKLRIGKVIECKGYPESRKLAFSQWGYCISHGHSLRSTTNFFQKLYHSRFRTAHPVYHGEWKPAITEGLGSFATKRNEMSWISDVDLSFATNDINLDIPEGEKNNGSNYNYTRPFNVFWDDGGGGVSSGEHYWEFRFKNMMEAPVSFGLTNKKRFSPGFSEIGLLYNGLLNNGNGVPLLSQFLGPTTSLVSTFGILASFTIQNRLQIFIFVDKIPLGLAFDIESRLLQNAYPVVQFTDSGSLKIFKYQTVPKNRYAIQPLFYTLAGTWIVIPESIKENKAFPLILSDCIKVRLPTITLASPLSPSLLDVVGLYNDDIETDIDVFFSKQETPLMYFDEHQQLRSFSYSNVLLQMPNDHSISVNNATILSNLKNDLNKSQFYNLTSSLSPGMLSLSISDVNVTQLLSTPTAPRSVSQVHIRPLISSFIKDTPKINSSFPIYSHTLNKTRKTDYPIQTSFLSMMHVKDHIQFFDEKQHSRLPHSVALFNTHFNYYPSNVPFKSFINKSFKSPIDSYLNTPIKQELMTQPHTLHPRHFYFEEFLKTGFITFSERINSSSFFQSQNISTNQSSSLETMNKNITFKNAATNFIADHLKQSGWFMSILSTSNSINSFILYFNLINNSINNTYTINWSTVNSNHGDVVYTAKSAISYWFSTLLDGPDSITKDTNYDILIIKKGNMEAKWRRHYTQFEISGNPFTE